LRAWMAASWGAVSIPSHGRCCRKAVDGVCIRQTPDTTPCGFDENHQLDIDVVVLKPPGFGLRVKPVSLSEVIPALPPQL
jgi:hypothetical protein